MAKQRKRAELTPRQREWLAHLRACRGSGQSMRSYAQRHGFSEHAMYQAAKVLRRRGVWQAARRVSQRPTPSSFVRVQAGRQAAEALAAWRIRLLNGVLLECPGPLAEGLLEAPARLR